MHDALTPAGIAAFALVGHADTRSTLGPILQKLGEYIVYSAPWLLEERTLLVLSMLPTVFLLISLVLIIVRIRVRHETKAIQGKFAEQVFLRKAADTANRAKGEFLAQMTHEIRTPMNAIMGFTDLVLKTELKPELREYLDTVRTSADWLMHIVNDVLEFSRMEGGALQLNTSEFCFAECIRSTIKIVQPEATARGLAVRHKIDPQIPALVCGDSTRLRQVLFNLLENAVKFTTTGSVMISATLEAKSAESLLIRISVADTGIGISPGQQHLIFEPFTQAEAVARTTSAGPGLGLAISRKLVNLMGGTIELRSQVGAGSTFQFTAWFQKTNAALETEKRSEPSRPAKTHLAILVAEDNAVNRRLVTKVLESAGHRVIPALNGKDAVTLFQSAPADLILMDIEMPQMDGVEATRVIRASGQDGARVPIYALTAHAMAADRERCFAAGMDGYITKPIEVDAVLKLVAEIAVSSPSAEVVPAKS